MDSLVKKIGGLFVLLGMAVPCFSDFSSRLNIKTKDGTVNTYPYQAQFPNGSLTDNNDGTVSISSNIADGSTNYVQTNPTTQQTTAFSTSSGTVATQLNLGQIKWQSKNNMMLYTDAITIMSMPDNQEAFFGYNTNIINSGGVFNTAFGSAAMPFPNTGNFNTCVGNSCMSGNLLGGENNNSMGYASLGTLRNGFYNNCMGGSSCVQLLDSSFNTGVGAYSLNNDQSGDANTAIGYRSLFYTTAGSNVGIGFEAGNSSDSANANTSGNHNIYIGPSSGQSTSTQLTNAGAIGFEAYINKSNALQLGGQQGSSMEWSVSMSTLVVNNHYNNAGRAAPGVSSCGTNPSVIGYDSAGTISVGSGATTSCTLTFSSAWTNTPTCVMSDNSTAVTGDISSISTTAVTFGFNVSIGSGKIYYVCVGSDS